MERRLAAILATDVVGYSRLIRDDETSTLAALKTHREGLIEPKVAQHRGRIVKLMGDGLLAEFPSAVEAVQCAVEIQHLFDEQSADIPEDKRIRYRTGINIGDIVVEGDDIYGDGVNVAARLETLADPGGICIARNVYNQVKDKLDLTFDHFGDHEVKNIAEPVTVYRVAVDDKAAALVTPVVYGTDKRKPLRLMIAAATTVAVIVSGVALWSRPWTTVADPASTDRMVYPLPDRPSIAVLPFDNFGSEPEHSRLADGITEDIITDLSRNPDIFVIARNSTFTYKGKAVKVQQVAEELGVRFVLEGSFQAADERARVTVQLIDALTGHHVWAEKYDRPIGDVFALQDELTQAIVGSLTGYSGQISEAGRKFILTKSPENLTAYDNYLLATEYKHNFTKEDNIKAQELYAKAIDLDPDFSRIYVALGWSHLNDLEQGWSEDPAASRRKFSEVAHKAVDLDPNDPEARLQLGYVYAQEGDVIGAQRAAREAAKLGANNADVLVNAGWLLGYAGGKQDAEEGIELLKRAIRLNPLYPNWYQYGLGYCQYFGHRFEDAIETLRAARPAVFQARLFLAASYAQLGLTEKAEEVADELRKEAPDFSAEKYAATIGIINESALAHFLDGVRKAGLAE